MSTSTSSSRNWGAFRQVNLGTNGIGAVTNMNQGYRGTTSSGIFTSRVVKEYNIQSGKSTIRTMGIGDLTNILLVQISAILTLIFIVLEYQNNHQTTLL